MDDRLEEEPSAGWPSGQCIDGVVSLGVDLATSAESTSLVAIFWHLDGRTELALVSGRCPHDRLVKVLGRWRYAVAAIDVPFGWPEDFVETLHQHQYNVLRGVPAAGSEAAEPWRVRQMALRATDQYVKDHYQQRPIAVGFEKLGATAAAWSLIEAELDSGAADRSGSIGWQGGQRIIETYPSAQMRAWISAGVIEKKGGIKRTPGNIEKLAQHFGVDLGRRAHFLDKNEHLRDAFVCALTAGLVATTSQCHPMTDNIYSRRSKSEGVIWLHDPSLPESSY